MNRFLLLLVLVASPSLWAGQRVGNGGSVVACTDREPVVLDFYEASLYRLGDSTPPALVTLPATGSETDIAHFLKARLSRFRPLSAPLVQLGQSLAKAEVAIGTPSEWTAAPLPSYEDSGEPYVLPPGCERRQAVVRTDTAVFVDPTVWQSLSLQQRGILLFHEWVYWIAVGTGHVDSQEVRQVTRVALSALEDAGAGTAATNAATAVLTPVDREVSAPADEVFKPEFYENAAEELANAVCSKPVTAAQAAQQAQRTIDRLEKYEALLPPKSDATTALERTLEVAYEIKREASNETNPRRLRRYCANE